MPCQLNPHAYSLMCWCPLNDADKVNTKSDKFTILMSVYVALIIRKDVGNAALTEDIMERVEEYLSSNLERWRKADEN